MNGNRRVMLRGFWGIFAVVLCGLLTACEDRPASLAVLLQYSPSSSVNNSVTLPLGQGKIYLMPIEDQRTNKTQIGVNVEDPDQPVPIISDIQPATWVHDVLAQTLSGNGLNLVSSADEADLLLNVGLSTFWVKEDSKYNARITLVVKVLDKQGTLRFNGNTSGQDQISARGLNPVTYNLMLSNALCNAMEHLLNNSDFMHSLVVAPAPPPAPASTQ